jgi:predicted RNase H-like nuclease (RuvC/YqgF family)
MDMLQTRLYELWEYCDHLQTRIFNLERQIQSQLAKGKQCLDMIEEVFILRHQLKRTRHQVENFKENPWLYS